MTTPAPSGTPKQRGRVASSPEEREKQLQNKAFDLAERQLDQGTASSQVISMLIKGGGIREKLELDKVRNENRLLNAKIEGMESLTRMQASVEKAFEAFRTYTGEPVEDEHDD